ncbi:hypothetical protein [Streptomyces sp. TLI_185]|uniref:hypothetical protein n=1 Tax=Streptomyces sp. TLI_185 TaxID=2485151 RepID=UPI000F515D6D|nr:hypothetical protein [Streptomyces sp. TLI_185]RPF34303.1 hypothetical protein EDD92_4252 [Streptomyces sp. TLI_185]
MNLLKRAAVAVASAALVTGVAGVAAAPAFATGQPGASCEDLPVSARPGHALTAPGSAFNPDGVSGKVYAGEDDTHSLANANSPNAVSQYDVACLKNSSR